jgi:hypothetical protein
VDKHGGWAAKQQQALGVSMGLCVFTCVHVCMYVFVSLCTSLYHFVRLCITLYHFANFVPVKTSQAQCYRNPATLGN